MNKLEYLKYIASTSKKTIDMEKVFFNISKYSTTHDKYVNIP
jgi:hypothetical protein